MRKNSYNNLNSTEWILTHSTNFICRTFYRVLKQIFITRGKRHLQGKRIFSKCLPPPPQNIVMYCQTSYVNSTYDICTYLKVFLINQ